MRALLLAAVVGLTVPGSAAATDLDFNRDVRPILARHCFKCHGPDEKIRKGKLRLDQRGEALRGGRSGRPAFVPGNPEDSEVVRRINGVDDEVMPPPAAMNPLSPGDRETIRRWIA